jgi:hypothetical protein
LSPQNISDNVHDLIYISIASYDINGNPKPYQTFRVTSSLLTADNQYITTNNNGFAKTKLKYSGSIPATQNSTMVTVQGLSYPSANAHANSLCGSFIEQHIIDITTTNISSYELKAVPDKLYIQSDGLSDVYIHGYTRFENQVPPSAPAIYWRKARTAYSALEEVNYSIETSTPGRHGYSGMVYADQYGGFKIGPFYAQHRTDPGHWFVVVDTELSATPSTTPVTIYGDIVYWHENYDNIHYSNEILPLPRFYTALPQTGTDFIDKPRFSYQHHDMEFDSSSAATVNWYPPVWFPISRYDQYQMGLLGSTPNVVSSYSLLNKEYEDS